MRKALSTTSSVRFAFKREDLSPEDIKETDQLQADAAFQKTAEQERWRDLVATVKQVSPPPPPFGVLLRMSSLCIPSAVW